jgi:hypothetical protein
MVLNLVQERGDLQFFLNGILFLGVGMAALSPLFCFMPLWAGYLQYHFVVNRRLWGLWQYSNTFGGFLALCLLLAFGMTTGDKRRDRHLLYDTCAGFLLLVLYPTTSRGAFLTGVIGLVALVLLAPRGWRGCVLLRVLIVGAAPVPEQPTRRPRPRVLSSCVNRVRVGAGRVPPQQPQPVQATARLREPSR